jgi:hypothetical protein
MTETTHPRLMLVINAMLLVAMTGAPAQAQEQAKPAPDEAQRAQEQLDRTPVDCVLLNRVARKVAANDSQVVFFIKGGTHYLNVLDGACQALTKGDTRLVFNYQTRSAKITRLCDTDGFTVERQTSRIGCSLGKFIPITPEEAAALTAQPVAAPPASSSAND